MFYILKLLEIHLESQIALNFIFKLFQCLKLDSHLFSCSQISNHTSNHGVFTFTNDVFLIVDLHFPNDVFLMARYHVPTSFTHSQHCISMIRCHIHDGVTTCSLDHNDIPFSFTPSLGLLELPKLLLLHYVRCNLPRVLQTQDLDLDPMGMLR